MSVSYSKEIRSQAAGQDLPLVTIDTGGAVWQGPVSKEGQRVLMKFFLDFVDKYGVAPCPTQNGSSEPSPKDAPKSKA